MNGPLGQRNGGSQIVIKYDTRDGSKQKINLDLKIKLNQNC